MRLFLLPISTRRTLIFCERSIPTLPPGVKPPISDRIITKSSETWTKWERAEKGWQKKVTELGNGLFRRIPFEEWGLKTLPAGTGRVLGEIGDGDAAGGKSGGRGVLGGKSKVECLFPGKFLDEGRVSGVLRGIAESRQGLHKRKLWQSVAMMPVTLPFAAVPIVPNLPFFYLCFRAYSHYRALFGGKLLSHLLSKNLVEPTASDKLDTMYAGGLLHATRQDSREAAPPSEEEIERVSKVVEAEMQGDQEEVMVLQKWNGKLLAEAYGLPEMEVEIERAVEQVEEALRKRKEEGEAEKKDR